MSVRTFLIQHGLIEPHSMPTASGEYRIECPSCHHANKKCYVNGEGKGVDCKHCPFRMSWRAFTRRYEPPTPEEVAMETYVAKAVENLQKRPDVIEYLHNRGITDEAISLGRLGFIDSSYEGEPNEAAETLHLYHNGHWFGHGCIVIPYMTDGLVEDVRVRLFEGEGLRYASRTGFQTRLYIPQKLDPSKPLFICEGEFDTLLLCISGHQAVGLPGAQNQGGIPKDYIKTFNRIYLCLDADDAGRRASDTLKKELGEVNVVMFPDGMDASDYINTFGPDSFEQLILNAPLFVDGKLQEEDHMGKAIDKWQDWAWTNGELLGAKISWAPRLQRALSGWSRGLFLVGALPNSGKSCFFVKSAYECAKENPDSIVVYISLDDDQEDAITRLVSLHSGLSFELIRTPRFSFDHPTDAGRKKPEMLTKFFDCLEQLKSMENLIFRDARYGRSLGYLKNYMGSLRRRFPDKRIVMFIDSLAGISAEGEKDQTGTMASNWKAYLAKELKYLSTLYDMCVVTPADFRKINDERRPTNDDLKDAAELAYEANGVLLGFNEMHVKGADRAVLKWQMPDGDTTWYPIFELNISKNKKSLYKGVIRFKFYPPTSNYMELTEDEDKAYTQLINQVQENNKSKSVRGNDGAIYTAEFNNGGNFTAANGTLSPHFS